MAEGLAIASGVAAVISLAGQVAQGVAFLYQFINDVREAPLELVRLSRDLEVLRPILDDIQCNTRATNQHSGLEAALSQCKEAIDELNDFLGAHTRNEGDSSRRRVWKQLLVAVKSPHYSRLLQLLGSAKISLLLALHVNAAA
jgi:hypothetical protein